MRFLDSFPLMDRNSQHQRQAFNINVVLSGRIRDCLGSLTRQSKLKSKVKEPPFAHIVFPGRNEYIWEINFNSSLTTVLCIHWKFDDFVEKGLGFYDEVQRVEWYVVVYFVRSSHLFSMDDDNYLQ